MSLVVIAESLTALSFPRVSGDEPTVTMPSQTAVMFSPRERG